MTSLKDPRIRTTIAPLTPRQREVLGLLARGYSNPQIGEALGISLDGAKWHVAEIMTRLGVDSREEAAAWWRSHNRPTARLARLARAIIPTAAWAKWGAAAAGIGVVSAGTIAAVVALNAGAASTPPAAAGSATVTASVTAAASATGTASAIAVAPSATSTATSTVATGLTPTPTPVPVRTGIIAVDAAIAAMEAHDYDGLAGQLVTQDIVCPPYSITDGQPPSCEQTSQQSGSQEVRPAYTYSECDGPQHYLAATAAASLPYLAGFPGQPGIPALYAVTRNADGTYRIIFQDESPNAFTLTVNQLGVTAVGRGCGVGPDTMLGTAPSDSVIYLAPGTPDPRYDGPTGVQPLDDAIEAMQAQDYAALASLLVTTPVECGFVNTPPGWQSPCAPGVATGTLQQVYLVGGCDNPTWMPASTAATTIAGMVSGTPHLYGVRENQDSTYSAIFADDDESAFTLTIESDGITTVSRACGAPPEAVLNAGGTIVAGPYS